MNETRKPNGLDWALSGPDRGGDVWLERRDDLERLDLGPLADVRERLAGFCGSVESGEVPGSDSGRAWDLDGPDTGGVVSLVWRGLDATDFRLGHVEPVTAAFAFWLRETDRESGAGA